MYNGQVPKGIGFLMVSAGGIVVAATAPETCGLYSCTRNAAPVVLGLFASGAAWIASMIDAYTSAQHINQQRGFRVGQVPVNPYLAVARNRATTVGLSLAIR